MRFFATSLVLLPAVLGLNINRRAPHARRQETTGQYLVRAAPGTSLPALRTAVDEVLGEFSINGEAPVEQEFSLNGLEGLVISGSEADAEAIEALRQVAEVEEDLIVDINQFTEEVIEEMFEETAEVEFAPGITVQENAIWGLARTSSRPPNATDYLFESSAGAGQTIYVVDTGIVLEHSEFGGRASHGFNAIETEGPEDLHGHGTHVASSAAGRQWGIAKNANIINVKVLAGNGRGTGAGVIAGNEWIINHARANGLIGRAVVNYSLGFNRPPGTQPIIDAAFRAVAEAGLPVIGSAGNANTNTLFQAPGGLVETCTVGAMGRNESRAWFSSFGSLVDIHAPGVLVRGAWIGGPTAERTISGTSMAAPHVAGVAAYLNGLEGPRSPQALCDRLVELSTRDVITQPEFYPIRTLEALDQTPNRLLYNGISELLLEPGFEPVVSLGNAAINAPLRNCNDEATFIGGRIYTEGVFNVNRCATHCRETSEFEASQGRDTRCRFFNTWVQSRNGVQEAQHCALYTQAWETSRATNTGQFQGGDRITISQSYAVTVSSGDGVPSCQ